MIKSNFLSIINIVRKYKMYFHEISKIESYNQENVS